MNTCHMSGAGNTFLVIDDRKDPITSATLSATDARALIRKHPRGDGLAIEGLIRIRSVGSSRAEAEFYNPDGTCGMLCGNGARCAVRYAVDHGTERSTLISLVLNDIEYEARMHSDGTVRIVLPPPTQLRYFPIGTLDNVDLPVWYVNVNSDHVVVDHPHDLSDPLIARLRHHPVFPRGANVNMLVIETDRTLRLATFERGVEGITQACGTGAVSAALSMWMRDPSITAYTIIPPSGRPLGVTIAESGGHIQSIVLRGDATYDNA